MFVPINSLPYVGTAAAVRFDALQIRALDRSLTHFVSFGLDPDCKSFHIFRIRTGFELS